MAWHDWAGLDVPSIDHQHDMSIKKETPLQQDILQQRAIMHKK